jgi:hypothetical protein
LKKTAEIGEAVVEHVAVGEYPRDQTGKDQKNTDNQIGYR